MTEEPRQPKTQPTSPVLAIDLDLEKLSIDEVGKIESGVLRQAIEQVRNNPPGSVGHKQHSSHDKTFSKVLM